MGMLSLIARSVNQTRLHRRDLSVTLVERIEGAVLLADLVDRATSIFSLYMRMQLLTVFINLLVFILIRRHLLFEESAIDWSLIYGN